MNKGIKGIKADIIICDDLESGDIKPLYMDEFNAMMLRKHNEWMEQYLKKEDEMIVKALIGQ